MPFGLGLEKVPFAFSVQAHTVAGLRQDQGGVEVALRLRRKKKEFVTPAVRAASGLAALNATLELPCTLYAGKRGFEPKAFEVAVVFGDASEPLTAEVDLAAYARAGGGSFTRTEAFALQPHGRLTLTIRGARSGDAAAAKAGAGLEVKSSSEGGARARGDVTGGGGGGGTDDVFDDDEDDDDFDDDASTLEPGAPRRGGADGDEDDDDDGKESHISISSDESAARRARRQRKKRAERIEVRVLLRSSGRELGTVRVRPTSKVSVLRRLVQNRVDRLPTKFGFIRGGNYVPAVTEASVLVSDLVEESRVEIYDVFQG